MFDWLTLLRKEGYAARRNIVLFVIVLVVLPSSLALGTAAFQHTIPENIPIGIAPESENVTEDEIAVIKAGAAIYATPETYPDPQSARRALSREEIYLAVEVPHGLFDENERVNLTVVSDQRIAPFQDAANVTAVIMDNRLSYELPASIAVEHQRVGVKHTLSEYLIPTALFLTVLVTAMLVIPYDIHRERSVFERVELASRVEHAVIAKIAFYGGLLVVPLASFQAISFWLGYRIVHFDPATLFVLVLSYLYLSCVAAGIVFAVGLRGAGLFLNLVVVLGVLTMSGLVYPVGFFSTIRLEIARSLPTHYSMISIRSMMMKNATLGEFESWLVGLGIVTLVAAGFLKLSIQLYRRQLGRGAT